MAHLTKSQPWVRQAPAWLKDREADHTGAKLHRVFAAGKYCDLMVTCGEKTYQTHKLMLSGQSKVFAAMIDAGFREGVVSHINLPDDDPIAVDFLLQYLYLNDYQPVARLILGLDPPITKDKATAAGKTDYESESFIPEGPCKLHAQIYEIADKYDIPILVDDAADFYYTRARPLQKLRGAALTEKCIEFLESIPTIYSTPSMAGGNDLRTMAASFMEACAAEIELCAQESPELAELREKTLRENPEFAVDVALRLMRKPTPVCITCAGEGLEAHGYKLGVMYCTACRDKGTLVCRINGDELEKAK